MVNDYIGNYKFRLLFARMGFWFSADTIVFTVNVPSRKFALHIYAESMGD